ncbi:MAG TPA: GNAT family N-acetyltransferase [Ktedonobacterales bacterium]|nr:GNAT family N-acetyltransferase [Ktedonobacterales bacterium]
MTERAMGATLETERLTLRPLTEADADHLVALDSDPEVMRYLNGGAATPRELIEWTILPRFLRSFERGDGSGVWAAIERGSGTFVGWFSFQSDDACPGEYSLGYRLSRAAWGHGYATEGARALILRGFAQLGARRISATTYQDNHRSRRVMERLDMRLARSYRLTAADLADVSETFAPSGEVWEGDDVEYELLRSEWERRVAGREE